MQLHPDKKLERQRRQVHGVRAAGFRWLLAGLLAVTGAGRLLCAEAQPDTVISEANVDGETFKFSTGSTTTHGSQTNTNLFQTGNVRLSSKAQALGILFGRRPGSTNSGVRLRYQLKGLDEQWQEAGGEMRLNVKFMDADNNIV